VNHPARENLDAYAHGLLEDEAASLGAHLEACASCRDHVENYHRESEALAKVLSADLQGQGKGSSRSQVSPRGMFSRRGRVWEALGAAALLVVLGLMFFWPVKHHTLLTGRMALEDGTDLRSGARLPLSKSWRLRALERSALRLADHSMVELSSGGLIELANAGDRGVEACIASGEAVLSVTRDSRPFLMRSSVGDVMCSEGSFRLKVIGSLEGAESMKGSITTAFVTVLAGSVSLSNAQGEMSLETGRSAIMETGRAPCLVETQEDGDALLKKLEELSARIARLEDEVQRLETRNKNLKERLKAAPGQDIHPFLHKEFRQKMEANQESLRKEDLQKSEEK
jgi:uncharacterized small protein (DUF1192 family)